MTHVQEAHVGSLTELLDHGRDLLQSGKAEKAIEIFQRATEEHPRNSKAWNDLGVALHATQKPNLAIEAFQMALLMDSGHVDAALNLAIFHYNRGRPIDGFGVLRAAYRKNPKNGDLRAEMLDQGLIKWRPLALIWKGGNHEVHDYAARTLKRTGFMVSSPERAVVAACSPLLEVKPASWVRYFRQVQPMLFLIPPGARVDKMAIDAAKRVGVPIHMMADYLPEKGWDADLEKVEQALEVILKEVPPAPARDAAPDPLITVVVTATRNENDCGGVLDRLAIQDLEPGLFEVMVVDDGIRPPVAKSVDASHFPYPCKLYRSESAGIFAARDMAVEDARGKWIFYFSQAERPGPRCLRRMLREELAERGQLNQAEAGGATDATAPVGKFWQYQLRETIRDEVGRLLDSRLNTVDFGLQMQGLMDSADFVRNTISAEKRMDHAELMEALRDGLLDEGRCIAVGRTHSQWITLLAEGLERKMEGYNAVFSTADVIAEEASASTKQEDSGLIHWTAGVLSHTLPNGTSDQESSISFLAFDQCHADVLDFTFESVKSSIQVGTVIAIKECASAFGEAKQARKALREKLEELAMSFEYIGIATDEESCTFTVRIIDNV
jgi:hypothetical protein